jgi:5-aminopentanamidase
VPSELRPLRIALAQTALAPHSVDESLGELGRLAAQAKRGGAGLLMLPEAFLCGYGSAESMRRLSIAQGEPHFGRLLQAASQHRLALLVGYAERVDGHTFNAAALVSDAGELLVNYRKMHLWGPVERAAFSPGEAPKTVDLNPGLRAAALICYDLEFPHVSQELADRGVDLLLVISATTAPYSVVPEHVVPARAYENGMFVAFCNHASGAGDFVGMSRVAAPDGSVLARAEGSGPRLLFAEIDPAAYADYRTAHCYRNDRRDLPPRGFASRRCVASAP